MILAKPGFDMIDVVHSMLRHYQRDDWCLPDICSTVVAEIYKPIKSIAFIFLHALGEAEDAVRIFTEATP